MAMVNMKMSREERKEALGAEVAMDQPEYPYGLCIDLDDDALAKLGITDLPKVGATIVFKAQAKVKSVSSNQYEGSEPESRMSLQITDMEIGESMTDRTNSAASMLYGG